jgi:Glycosyl transferases group 1
MERILRFYISHEISYGVATSQIFNWSTHLYHKGINTEHLIFYTNQAKLLSMINGSPHKIRCFRSSRKPILRDIIYFLTLIVILLRLTKEKDKIILQTRNNGVTFVLSILKLFFKFKIVYEVRGFGENAITVKTFLGRLKQRIREKRDQKLIRLADKVFCVSNEMKRVIINLYSLAAFENKFVVFPGVSSSKDFYSDEHLRSIVREDHKIGDNSIVLLYSGNLDQPWQVPDQIFKLFKFIAETIEARLFMITPNVDIVKYYIGKHNIKNGSVFYKNCEYSELNKYYNAADYGLLLRENKLLNRVASPTKFSEYVLSGLPVIITESIIDYSNFVRKNNVGIVVNSSEMDKFNNQEGNKFLSLNFEPKDLIITSKERRYEISKLGQELLSKECFIDKQSNILNII